MKRKEAYRTFEPAALQENLAPRHALLNRFHTAAARRLVMVSAPAGCGKTLSTMLWLRDSERDPLWIRLSEQMNSAAAFYKILGRALWSTQPENDRFGRILLGDDFASSPVENILEAIDALEPNDDLHAVVFDDMHLAEDEEIVKPLTEILLRLP